MWFAARAGALFGWAGLETLSLTERDRIKEQERQGWEERRARAEWFTVLFDQRARRLAGPEAADLHARRQPAVRLLHGIGLLTVVNFNLQTDLARGEFFGGYLHACVFLPRDSMRRRANSRGIYLDYTSLLPRDA